MSRDLSFHFWLALINLVALQRLSRDSRSVFMYDSALTGEEIFRKDSVMNAQ